MVSGHSGHQLMDDEEDDRSEEDDPNAAIARRNQTTAVILCGVIGALFDLEQDMSGNRDPALIALGGNLTRLTARALMYLVLVPSNSLSPHTPLRRAAIDLIGRGFILWEPHLEVSKEIARYNTMATNSQTLNINMAMHVLSRSKAE